MGTYRDLVDADVPSRAAAVLVGIPRATATRTPRTPVPRVRVVPANKLSLLERAEILKVVNSPEFVDLPPIQIYAKLLDEGIYLGSISTIYRILNENKQVKDRRRQARHLARAIPELVATGPGQVFSWDITKLAGPVKGYNHTHHHTGIGLNTPADVHFGLAEAKARQRSTILADARARNPECFTTNHDPEVLTIPTTAWINNPAERTEQKLAA